MSVKWFSDEMMFYGGLTVVLITVIAAVIYFSVSQVRKAHLDAQLDLEYGKKPDKRQSSVLAENKKKNNGKNN